MRKTEQAVSVALIKDEEGRYLYVQELKPQAYMLWGPPGGHIEKGETSQAAAIRETHEETGFIIELLDDKPVYENCISQTEISYQAHRARIIGGQSAVRGGEIADAKWFLPKALEELHSSGGTRSSLGIQAILEAEARENFGN